MIAGRRWGGAGALWRIGIAALQALVWWVFLPKRAVFPLDDAYIHLAYVRCLVQTGTFCLNPGEPSLGTSSPLWVMLMAGPYRLGLDPYWSAQLLALGFFVGTAFLVFDLASRASLRQTGVSAMEARLAGAAAALLVALNGDLHWLNASGMETSMLLFLGLLVVRLYVVRGFDPLVGLVLGLMVMTRAPSVALGAVLVVCDVVQRRRFSWLRGAVAACLTYLPFAVISLRITGGLFPTSAKGKLLTFVRGGFDVGEMLHYAGRFLEFQKYVWANVALLAVVVAGVAVVLVRGPRKPIDWVTRSPECAVLLLWGLAHFLLYALSFRTIGQEGRYLAEENVVLAVVGPVALVYLRRHVLLAPVVRAALAACVALAVLTLPSWKRVYACSVAHVDQTFVPMAEWVAHHTPADARVAAFDIGTLRYVGDRYTIDLGGLVDPKVYPCLRRHACAEYARGEGATYFLYSKDPEADLLTGIYEAERAGTLRQTPLVTFQAADYDAPTMNHSSRLELDRIDGWFSAGDARARAAPDVPVLEGFPRPVAEGVELVGAAVDTHAVRYLLGYPYFVDVTLVCRAASASAEPLRAHFAIFDEHETHILQSFQELVAPPRAAWQPGQTIRDRHFLMLRYDAPAEAPGPRAVLRVAFTASDGFDAHRPELYTWTTLSPLDVIPSAMHRPLAPL